MYYNLIIDCMETLVETEYPLNFNGSSLQKALKYIRDDDVDSMYQTLLNAAKLSSVSQQAQCKLYGQYLCTHSMYHYFSRLNFSFKA